MGSFARVMLAVSFALIFVTVGFAGPAGAKLFTVNFEPDLLNELDGSDDVPFSFTGSSGIDNGCGAGVVCGEVRAVDIFTNQLLLEATVAKYVDFLGNFPGGVDFLNMDVLIVDVVLFAGSAPVDEISIAVGSDPLGLDPDGGGYFLGCVTGLEIGCRNAVTGGGEIPVAGTQPDIQLEPGIPPVPLFCPPSCGFPGAVEFSFFKGAIGAGNLDAGETSVRLFLAYADTGPQSPLSKAGQTAVFMISSGVNHDVSSAIIPEPGTVSLLGFGLVVLALSRARRWR